MKDQAFTRVLLCLFLGLLALFWGAQLAWNFYGREPWVVAVGGGLSALAFVWIWVVQRSDAEQRFVTRALRTVVWPERWKVMRNKILRDRARVRTLVARGDGLQFAVGIMPWKGFSEVKDALGRDTGRWIRGDARPLSRSQMGSLKELLQAGKSLGQPAILWLPKVPSGRNARHADGDLYVVTGSARHLVQAIKSWGALEGPTGRVPPESSIESVISRPLPAFLHSRAKLKRRRSASGQSGTGKSGTGKASAAHSPSAPNSPRPNATARPKSSQGAAWETPASQQAPDSRAGKDVLTAKRLAALAPYQAQRLLADSTFEALAALPRLPKVSGAPKPMELSLAPLEPPSHVSMGLATTAAATRHKARDLARLPRLEAEVKPQKAGGPKRPRRP